MRNLVQETVDLTVLVDVLRHVLPLVNQNVKAVVIQDAVEVVKVAA